MTQTNETFFYRISDLCKLIPASRSTVHRLVKSGVLPQPHRLTPRLVVWKKTDIDGWADSISNSGYSTNEHQLNSKISLQKRRAAQ
jgi:predicted DNA-binding transcriptional regulator AlpA